MAPKKKTPSGPLEVAADTHLQLDPAVLLPGDNIRFGLKKYRIDRLADMIVEEGGVKSPIEVRPLTTEEKEGNNGYQYRILTGNYRHAAAMKLNTENKAGILIPAIVRHLDNQAAILKRQLSENQERENMSPMDSAVAIKKLLDASLPKLEIRKMFARPTGKKGITLQPASNAWVNMMLSFLDFPKKIQDKIHDGRLSVSGAYSLSTKPKDQWDTIMEKVEADRLKGIEAEEKEEAKFLEAERKAAEADEKKVAAEKALTDAQDVAAKSAEAVTQAQAKRDEVAKAAADAYSATLVKGLDKDAKKVAADAKVVAEAKLKDAEAVVKAAESVHAKNLKEVSKLDGSSSAAAKLAETKKAELETKRQEAEAKKAAGTPATPAKAGTPATPAKPVSAGEVHQAASKVDGGNKAVKLTAAQMRDGAKSLILLSSTTTQYQKTRMIGEALTKFFDGEITDGQLHVAVSKLTGEYRAPAGATTTAGAQPSAAARK